MKKVDLPSSQLNLMKMVYFIGQVVLVLINGSFKHYSDAFMEKFWSANLKEIKNLGDLIVLQEVGKLLNSTSSAYSSVANSFEYGNKHLGSIKAGSMATISF